VKFPERKRKSLPDLTGLTFGRLTVIKFFGYKERNNGNCRMWLCRCECGKETTPITENLKNGNSTSCGCLNREVICRPKGRQPYRSIGHGVAAKNQVIHSYKNRAKRASLVWDLTAEQIESLFAGECHYCGCAPSSRSNPRGGYGDYLYNGIDRLDSLRGYELGNVVSCCGRCNIAKNTTSYGDFIEWIKRVHSNLAKQPGTGWAVTTSCNSSELLA
jgi:hypothetical protein